MVGKKQFAVSCVEDTILEAVVWRARGKAANLNRKGAYRALKGHTLTGETRLVLS